MSFDFDFHIGGLEDAILDTLKSGIDGVKEFATYSGELDSENLKQALADLSPRFPLIMVSYANGVDTQDAVTSPTSVGIGKTRPVNFRHDCSFVVICANNDPRGDYSRRRGAKTGDKAPLGTYQMISKVRELLGGAQFFTEVEGKEVLLNHKPLFPATVEFIARKSNVTAYAIVFETYFRFETVDRRVAGTPVSSVAIGVESEPLREITNAPEPNLPGIVKIG